MTLTNLQKVLGEQIEIISDLKMDEEERQEAYQKADMISRLAKQMINNADIILRTDKLAGEGKIQNSTIQKVVGDL